MGKKAKWGCGCATVVVLALIVFYVLLCQEVAGGPRHRETVDGVTYTFRVQLGVAALSPTKFRDYPIDINTVGALNIPATLGGYPLKRIGMWAFEGYRGLTSVVIPDGVEDVDFYAFQNCSSLEKVVLPKPLKELAPHLFDACSSLTDVTIPDSVTNICSYVFTQCVSLKSITIPKSVVNLHKPWTIFSVCTNLQSIVVDADNPNYSSIDGVLFDKAGTRLLVCPAGKQGTYVVPNAVEEIGTNAFAACNSLASISVATENQHYSSLNGVLYNKDKTALLVYPVGKQGICTIPASVETIEPGLLQCPHVTEIFADSASLYYSSVDGVLFNKTGTILVAYPTLRQGAYVIPDTVTKIGERAFAGCHGLTGITFTDNVVKIGKQAFVNCTGVISLQLPKHLEKVNEYVFEGCSGLSSVVIPAGVTRVEFGAFWACSNITSVVVPECAADLRWAFPFSDEKITNVVRQPVKQK